MAKVVANRVMETSATTGTGAFTLAGAVVGYQSFSAAPCVNGDTVDYYAEDIDANGNATANGWEIGLGTWGTGAILTRTTIVSSSNANAAVSWAAGTRRIGLTLPAPTSAGTSFGRGATFTSNGTAFGYNCTAAGGVAIGNGATVSNAGTAIGTNASAGAGIAIGYGASGSLSLGYTAASAGSGAIAIGGGSSAPGNQGVAIGDNSNAQTDATAIGNGSAATTSGTALGRSASTNSQDRAVAIGMGSYATRYREFTKSGDGGGSATKQSWSVLHWYGDTTAATPVELLLGGTAAKRCTLTVSSALQFRIQLIANVTGGAAASWEIVGCIKCGATASAISLVGTPTVTSTGSDSGASGWSISVGADTTNGALVILVTGAASTTIRWNAIGNLSELRF